MKMFEPIAIVGRGCVLPGAHSVAQLWDVVRTGKVVLGPVPAGRWRLDKARLLRAKALTKDDEFIVSDIGGMVSGFETAFSPAKFDNETLKLGQLDPLVHWLIHAGRQALQEAGPAATADRSALIAGNLSYPTDLHTRFVEEFWTGTNKTDPRNRFSSGLPIALAAEALGLGRRSFALDAACSSSLYAIKLACDRLHDHEADLVLAGGVNRADDLFLHLGFTALQALSPTGQSRPFHQYADGLIPSEGCALVALKRLEDALNDGNRVLGVIRGIGLSNDGREEGFLAPAEAGQIAAMNAAYGMSGLTPADIGFLEAHATGTRRGDTIELHSIAKIWGGTPRPAIGSLKANLGHTITASGGASLLKVLSAFEARALPSMPPCNEPLEAIAELGFSLVTQPAPWPDGTPLRAAISNFGFGGNNAHLIVEAWDSARPATCYTKREKPRHEPIVIAGMGVLVGDCAGLSDFARKLFSPCSDIAPAMTEIALAAKRLGFPPNDLKASLAQQTSILAVAAEACAQIGPLPGDRTGVYVGMGCDSSIARHGLRMRLREIAGGESTDEGAWRQINADAAPALTAPGVIGAMPNIPANRLNAQRDWRAPGFTVSSEEQSGTDALRLAMRALQSGEIDYALVAASDFSQEPAHRAAAQAVLPTDRQAPGDAAVALILTRQNIAEKAACPILAIVGSVDDGEAPADTPAPDLALDPALGTSAVTARFGHAHAASGLLHIAAGALCAAARVRLDDGPAWPSFKPDEAATHIRVTSFTGRTETVKLLPTNPFLGAGTLAQGRIPAFAHYAGASRDELLQNLKSKKEGTSGKCRLGLIAENADQLGKLFAHAVRSLEAGHTPSVSGLYFGEGDFDGEVAHCFTGAAAAYPGAGRELLLAFPEIGGLLAERFAGAPALGKRLYGQDIKAFTPETQLTGCALVCQAHSALTQDILQIPAHAAIGLSSGETNALLAFNVWRDLDDMLGEIDKSGLYGHELTGRLDAARRHWGLTQTEPLDWRCWRIAAPVSEVTAALRGEPKVFLTIIHHSEDCVIGGEAVACGRVVQKLGRGRAIELGLDMVVHCPPLAPFADAWRRIHTRKTHLPATARIYTNAGNRAYTPTTEAAAEAITRQALEPVDFPKTIEQAYADGIRVFIEHGPRSILTNAIDRILGDRPHVAVFLNRFEQSDLKVLSHSLTRLWAAGVPMALGTFRNRLRILSGSGRATVPEEPILRLPAHRPDISWPPKVTNPIRPIAKRPDAAVMQPPPAHRYDYDLAGLFEEKMVPAGLAAMPPMPEPVPKSHSFGGYFVGLSAQHRAYLTTQKSVQDQFMTLRRQGAQLLAGGINRTKQISAPRLSSTSQPASSTAPQTRAEAASKPARHEEPATRLSREQLEIHAGGKISDIFGPLFTRQDGYAKQVRMPQPPLLLADRAMALEGEPGTMRKGRVVTETDVKENSWYLHVNRMSPGVVIESGQADLLLISWLGADFLNQGERVYRLLGCELTFFGELPQPGETLRYDIHVDGHAKTGDIRLFFFHYDCYIGDRLLLSVRNGQAGFFSEEELAGSGGVLWDAEDAEPKPEARLDPPPIPSAKRQFSSAEVDAFRAGDAFTCFGAGFELSAAHQRTPALPGGRLALLDDIAEFDPNGGPWGRGYLRARARVKSDAWFYQGHFKNDPCMPGTLMADAATQALAFAMAAMGFTLPRDGWRFEPVPEETAKFVCRGQVIPDTDHMLDYEVFIEEIIDGETPTVFAALLCRSDGFKVFGCERFGLRLVPDWPLTTRKNLLTSPDMPHYLKADVRGDYNALMACAWGRPSLAFGDLYGVFDGARQAPRLPGPPYHFMTRVLSVDGEPGMPLQHGKVVSEYAFAPDEWYFAEGQGEMPFPVLLEALLQPCGWYASYMGFAAAAPSDMAFRNLDGPEAVLHRAVTPASGPLHVEATLDRFAEAAGTTIVSFSVSCTAAGEPVMSLKTAFGFFSPAALRTQMGLRTTEDIRAQLTETSPSPERSMQGRATHRLRMVDTVTGYWPEGGASGMGHIRGRQVIDPGAWYFKAHFFQDPVQPGSLGLQALTELGVEFLRTKYELSDDWTFEPIALGAPLSWKFRGQVLPTNREVITHLDALSLSATEAEVTAQFTGSLWVDGMRIYEMPRFSVRARRGGRTL